MEEKEKLPNERELKEATISVLKDIKKSFDSDGSIDSFLTRWQEQNPNVPDCREVVRKAYAEHIGLAIDWIQLLL